MAKRLVLIDGHAILHRAYHAFPQTLTTRKGELVNAVYGFTRMLLTVIDDLQPECLAVVFDLPKPTFRHKEFLGYQVQRPKMEESLAGQIERVRQVVGALGIPIFTAEGFEADDVIATLAKQALKGTKVAVLHPRGGVAPQSNAAGAFDAPPAAHPGGEKKKNKVDEIVEVVIVTGDRDIMQLVTDRVKVYAPQKGFSQAKLFGPEEVEEHLGVRPNQIVDYKALVGDSSDNYPGVAGIGPKTAINLIAKFRTLEGVYASLESLENEKLREKLQNGKESALLSQRLAQIVTTAPVKLDLKMCRVKEYDPERAKDVFEELEFKSLLKKLPGAEDREQRDKNLREKKEGEQTRLF